jgi:glycosyltransferase involved in cell wall biosynthesis
MRVVLADPAAFTPQYDHELAHALAGAGADVRLVTSHFRFGEIPGADGYRREEAFYPVSSRLFRRSKLRLPVKAAEHPLGMARLARAAAGADVTHLQWLAWAQLDERLLRLPGFGPLRGLARGGAPTIFTAHDLLPRRTAARAAMWQRLLGGFDRVVVHSERGRATLAGLGVAEERLRVIPHPVFPSSPTLAADPGRTLLCLGVIRPYKGLLDAIGAAKQVPGARLIVAGDPMEPIDHYRDAAGSLAEWRLGYLSDAEIDATLAETAVALFPYRAELDQSGALLRALGAGVPAVVYDVGGLGDPIRTYGAGRVVEPGDVKGFARAIRELLVGDALAEARAGAARARAELTWEASARAHLAVYEEVAR